MRHENGSAMLWIFIGILLFAALGMVMMQGSRTSSGMLSSEEVNTVAKQIINYGNEMKSAVQRLKFRGCKDNEYNFANSLYLFSGPLTPAWVQTHNTNSPDDLSCNIFDVNGGGMTPQEFRDYADPSAGGGLIPGDAYLATVAIEGIGTSAADLALKVVSLNVDICRKINEVLGTTGGTADKIPNELEIGYNPYNTANSDFATFDTIGDTATEIAGKSAFCIQGNDASTFGHYYVVLLGR